MAGDDLIQIRGARTHNLRDVDLDLPRGRLVVFTGVSGSGKSSLAFDTLHAEGQRRYLESAAPFARQFVEQLPAPGVDLIRGLPPTLSVGQHERTSGNPRSTVATLTEIHDFLRILYARCGDAFCPQCGLPIGVQTVEQMLDAIDALPEGEKIHLLAPMVRGEKGTHKETFQRIKREGFVRARINGAVSLIDGGMELDADREHTIEMVVDRQVVRPGLREKIAESVQTALKHGGGSLIIATMDEDFDWHDRLFSTRFACPACNVGFPELEPRTFSFNSPYGACPACEGLGFRREFTWEGVVGDPSRTVEQGALLPFREEKGGIPAALKKEIDASLLSTPVASLSEADRERLWNSVRSFLQKAGEADDDIDPYDAFRLEVVCDVCHGARLGPAGRSVRIAGRTISELTALPLAEAERVIAELTIRDDLQPVAEPLLRELRSRLDFLVRVGVGYIELSRPVGTLSGGESQRVRLAGCIGAGLRGVCYVLDEPSIGLHPRDSGRLWSLIDELRDRGNTVVVVEHDETAMRRADWLVDVGPEAGPLGGRIVAAGSLSEIQQSDGLTADYLNGRRSVGEKTATVSEPPKDWLELRGVEHRNLKGVDFRIPLNRLTAVTGVSGSGKSSLVMEVLAPAVRRALGLGGPPPGKHASLAGFEQLSRLIVVDQSPIGRSPKSTPATYAGLLEPLRSVFAQTREAKSRGFAPTRFAYNHKSGQCPECKGLGAKRLNLAFLPDEFVACEVCQGKRYNPATLAVNFRGKSIADALAMTIAEASAFFANHPKLAKPLSTLCEVGLGYLKLDQWATTLSGGEAQRLKLAAELARGSLEPTLFILDEPTTGLHLHDVAKLLALLRRLVAEGSTVLVIEHHLELIRCVDWIVDLGPEGGDAGGRIVAEGTVEQVSAAETPTGVALRQLMSREP